MITSGELAEMSKLDPKTAKEVYKTMCAAKAWSTKTGYVSAFRQWVYFCLERNKHPLRMPIKTELAQYWIQDRTTALDGICSLRRWLAVLRWISVTFSNKIPAFRENPKFNEFLVGLKNRYKTDSDKRRPLRVKHLVSYSKACGIGKNLYKIPFNQLLYAMIAQIYFFSGSRPNELSMNYTKESMGIDKIWRGLKCGDYEKVYDLETGFTYYRFTVRNTKNQRCLRIFKYIFMGDTRCKQWKQHSHDPSKSNPCSCFYLNPMRLFVTYIERRRMLYRSIKYGLEEGSKLHNLAMKHEDWLFVDDKGSIFSSNKMSSLINDIIEKVPKKALDSRFIKPYSLRIGCTTTCALAGLTTAQILRFVGWANSGLPQTEMGYMRFSDVELSRTPFIMLHQIREQKLSKNHVYDPWTQHSKWKN